MEHPGEHRDLVVDLDAVGVLDLLDELGRGLALGAEADDQSGSHLEIISRD